MSGTRAGARYCHTNCRSRAFRQRHRFGKPAVDESTNPPTRKTIVTTAAFAKAREPAPESAPAENAQRVAMERQLLAQAPSEAAGYRLVLPPRAEFEEPGYVPTGTGYGQPAWWTLRPFQLPDDDRLLPGHIYKVVWVDVQGARVPPAGSRALPCLHYFLGAAGTESERADEYEALLKLARGTSQESAVREEIVRQRLCAMQQGTERAQPSAHPQPSPSEAPLRESTESLREQPRAKQQEAERAQPSARPQPPPSEAPPHESVESLRKQLVQMTRELEELRRPKYAPSRPRKKASLDSALKSQAPAVPTTPQGEPPAPPEAVAVEPGLSTNPKSESHEPKQAVEQSPACHTAPTAPDESQPAA